MTIKEFLIKTLPKEKDILMSKYHQRPRIICNDGFSMSVQANGGAYSQPKDIIENGEYKTAEIGYPSGEESLISDYAEDEKHLTETVYGYVPISIIDEVLEKHWGIDEEKTFENNLCHE